MTKPIGDGKTAQERYIAKNIVRVVVSLNRNTDADILAYLGGVENRQGYVKSLIRADIAAREGNRLDNQNGGKAR